MADIRIKDLTTTAAASSADDYIAVDGTSNGTRKLSAATPSFATSVTVPSVTGVTDLTLTGGSSGASLVLGHTAGASMSSASKLNLSNTTSASNSYTGALVVGNGLVGSAAVNVAIGGGNINAGGTGTFGGNVAVGGATLAASSLVLRGSSLLSGTTQVGLDSETTFSSGATAGGIGVYSTVVTAASAFTMTSGYAFQADTPVVGAASAITTQTGMLVKNQGAAGITNAYGIDIAAQSGAATTNIGLRNAGITSLTNPTPSTGSTSGALQVAGGIYAGAASVFGANLTVTNGATPLFLAVDTRTSAGGGLAALSLNTSDQFWQVQNNGGNLLFRDNTGPITALTITKGTGAATFAGAVSAAGTVQVTATTTPSSGSGLEIQGGANPTLFAYNRTGSAYLPLIITGSTLSMKMNNVDAFTLTGASAAASTATFAGAVSINNTVGTAAAVASTHKVTMVIGGVTYYLLATNVP